MEKVITELKRLLGDEERDFKIDPITNAEGHELMHILFELVGDKDVPEDLAIFYLQCYEIVKQHVILS